MNREQWQFLYRNFFTLINDGFDRLLDTRGF